MVPVCPYHNRGGRYRHHPHFRGDKAEVWKVARILQLALWDSAQGSLMQATSLPLTPRCIPSNFKPGAAPTDCGSWEEPHVFANQESIHGRERVPSKSQL